jgi:hypothetical protein
VPDLHAPQPRHPVEEPVPLAVPDVDALAAGDDPGTLLGQLAVGGEGVEVVAGVEVAPASGGVGGGGHEETFARTEYVTLPRRQAVVCR